MYNVSISQLKQVMNSENVIDIRDIEKFNGSHIIGSHNIPMTKLIVDPNKYLDKEKIYYIYCQKGLSSIKVVNILRKEGYNVYNVIGGYERWLLDN